MYPGVPILVTDWFCIRCRVMADRQQAMHRLGIKAVHQPTAWCKDLLALAHLSLLDPRLAYDS